MLCYYLASTDLVTYIVTIDLNMFGSLVQDKIGCYGDCCSVVTIQEGWWKLLNSHIL